MSVLIHKENPITGKMDWEESSECYDYHQEVARSSYADMLHDTERNAKYQAAVESAILCMHKRGKEAHVLDIGTGTGLLSMMAARAGADSIVACEAFYPMAQCARDVVKQNGFENQIKIVSKRSTQLTVGPNCDLTQKANILVTEVFDTELIGEGAYLTFSHAHEMLLEKDCIVVPSSATVYAQVVDSKFVSKWNKIHSIIDDNGSILLDTPLDIVNCPGAAAVHDVQLSQISPQDFKTIVSPEAVFRFDWSGKAPLAKNRSIVQVFKALCEGVAQAVFMWWDLDMDTEGKILLSCAPFWAHPDHPQSFEEIPWRDHWMQAIYYLPKMVQVERGQELTLISSHDEFSLWFNLESGLKVQDGDYKRPVCTCGAHAAWSRSRIGQLNDNERNSKYIRALKPYIKENTVCLSISDSSLLALAAAKMGCKKVFCIESNVFSRMVLENFILHNKLQGQVEIFADSVNVDTILHSVSEKVDLVCCEPYHFSSILPWENIKFWYQKCRLHALLKEGCVILPQKCIIYGLAVEFKDLWKIRARLEKVQGFEMKFFDDLIETSSCLVDKNVEAQPLWEYPSRALSEPVKLLELSFDTTIPETSVENTGLLNVIGEGQCNGVALWVDWDLDGSTKNLVSTGPSVASKVGSYICWDVYTRQGVYFLSEKPSQLSHLSFRVSFHPQRGNLEFIFKPEVNIPPS